MMWTRSKNSSRTRNQRRAERIDGGKAAPSPWFHNHQKLPGTGPRFANNGFRGSRRKFAQHIRNHYQIVRIAGEPGAQVMFEPLRLADCRQRAFCRQIFSQRKPMVIGFNERAVL